MTRIAAVRGVLSALIGLALITLTLLPLALTRGLILSAALRRIGLLRFFSRLDRLVPITALVLALWLTSLIGAVTLRTLGRRTL